MTENRRDNHHACNFEKEWSVRPDALAIRENPSLIAHNMARSAHNLLHYMTAPVPVPGIHTLKFVAQRLDSGLDVITGIDKYSTLVELSLRHPKTKCVDRRLGELSVEAMRAQIPYIVDGLPNEQRRYFV